MDLDKLKKMAGTGAVRTGGKGSARRKKAPKKSTAEERKFESTLQKVGVTPLASVIQEANIFVDDLVTQFTFPIVQVKVEARIWVISGVADTKKLKDLLPGILNQLGSDTVESLRDLAERLMKSACEAAAEEEENKDISDLSTGQTFEDVD